MKVIIAGSRSIYNMAALEHAIERSGYHITEVVSGGARGVDQLGERWARKNGIPVTQFLANWEEGPKAGPIRNREMAEYSDALIALHDGTSRGTMDMLIQARRAHIKVYVLRQL